MHQRRGAVLALASSLLAALCAWAATTSPAQARGAAGPDMLDGHHDTTTIPRILDPVGRVDVTGRFSAFDADGVASYDVERRVATPGHRLGHWQAPKAWQGITVKHVTTKLRPGAEICFRARAYDPAGHRSRWGDRRCTTEPYDDRAFARHGRATGRHVSTARGERSRSSDGLPAPPSSRRRPHRGRRRRELDRGRRRRGRALTSAPAVREAPADSHPRGRAR
jgi:hypothetical protein